MTGLTSGYMLASIYLAYALSFLFGIIWIKNSFYNNTYDRAYMGGDVLSTFYGIIFGLFALGIGAPNF
jgi:hypothetical protein